MTEEPDGNLRSRLIGEADAAEAEWENGEAAANLVRTRAQGGDPSQVYSVRIPVRQLERLRRTASARGVKPTALMREWVLERLAAEELAASAPETRIAEVLAEAQGLADVVARRAVVTRQPDSSGEPVRNTRRPVRLGGYRRLTVPPDDPTGVATSMPTGGHR